MEQGIGMMGIAILGMRNGKQEWERGTGNGERGTGNGERGTRNGERGTGNGEREIKKLVLFVIRMTEACNKMHFTLFRRRSKKGSKI